MMRLSNIQISSDGQMKVTLEITGPGGSRSDVLTFETTQTYLDRLTLKEIEREAIVKVGHALANAPLDKGF